MKTAGIVLLILGIMAIIGGLMQGHFTPASLAFIVLGAFLISRANKKKEEIKKKKQWEINSKENE